MMTKPTYEELEQKVKDLERTICEKNGSKEVLHKNLHILQTLRQGPLSINIVCLDNAYNYLFFNKVHETAVRDAWGSEIVLGSNLLGYIVDDNDRAAARSNFDRALGGETFTLIQEFGTIKRYFWESIYSPIVSPEGQVTGVIVFSTDVTEREKALEALKQSEQINKEGLKLLQLVVDTIPMRLFWKDLDLVYLGCNHLFAKDAGFSEPNDLVGADDFSMGWKEYAELYRKDDFDVIKSGKPKLNYEEPRTTPEGKHITLLTSKVPIRNINDEIIGLLGIYEDITKRKREETELLRMQKLDSLGRLAGGIAHNFNNILTAINGNISLAKSECSPNDKIYKRLAHAETACLKAKELSQQFLIFSRGGIPVKEPLVMANLIQTNSQLALSGTRSTCKYTIADNLWNIEADAGQIGQVFTNILINADQAMPNGGLIRLNCENVVVSNEDALPLKNGNYVKVSIRDQGTGIPKENLDKIFDPYFTTKDTGTGLGLASSYSIIKKHEGYLCVESTSDSGTVFTLFIPASTASAKTIQTIESSIVPGDGYILVMDDDEIIRTIVGSMLKQLGYRFECAEDGEKALVLYQKAMESGKPFDLVLMDMIIPNGMGGEEATQKLLAIDPNAKVIVSSGYSNSPIMSNHKRYGFSGILKKPYCLEELKHLVKQFATGDKIC